MIALDQMQKEDIYLSDLPPHLQLSILRKMEFPDFVKYKTCSRHALAMSNLVKTKLQWTVSEMSWREFWLWYQSLVPTDNSILSQITQEVQLYIDHLYIDHNMDERACDKVSKALIKIGARVDTVHLTKSCCERNILTANSFGAFCEAAKAKRIHIWSAFSTEIFLQSSIQNMTEVVFISGAHTSEEDFSMLKAARISLQEVPEVPETLHRFWLFFQQWSTASRRIDKFTAGWSGNPDDLINIALKDLHVQQIWSKATHRRTPLARLNLWRYSLSHRDQAFICFATNSSPLLISFLNNRIRVTAVTDIDHAYRYLFNLFKVCPPSLKIRIIRGVGSFFRHICLG